MYRIRALLVVNPNGLAGDQPVRASSEQGLPGLNYVTTVAISVAVDVTTRLLKVTTRLLTCKMP